MLDLPSEARRSSFDAGSPAYPVVTRHLTLLDAALAGMVEGLYLVGSLALDDFHAGHSDIDFVAVMREPLDDSALAALATVHTVLRGEYRTPHVDGIYITAGDLLRNPLDLGALPHSYEGVLTVGEAFEANPAVWLTLRNHSPAVRGPAMPRVWHDPGELHAWTLQNLNSYWRRLAGQIEFASAAGRETMSDDHAVWCISGITRLHYTLATADVTSKSGACRYALHHFPERFHPLLHTVLSCRAGEAQRAGMGTITYSDAGAYMEYVLADANRGVEDTP